MAKKKTVLVETKKAGRNWSITVSAQGEDLFQLFGSIVRNFTADKSIAIVNVTDPFSSPPKRKKKSSKSAAAPAPNQTAPI